MNTLIGRQKIGLLFYFQMGRSSVGSVLIVIPTLEDAPEKNSRKTALSRPLDMAVDQLWSGLPSVGAV